MSIVACLFGFGFGLALAYAAFVRWLPRWQRICCGCVALLVAVALPLSLILSIFSDSLRYLPAFFDGAFDGVRAGGLYAFLLFFWRRQRQRA